MTECLRVAAGERAVLRTSKVRVPLWESCLCILPERHTTAVIHEPLIDALIHRSEVLPNLNIIERVIARAHQVFGLLSIGKGKEVGLSVESAIRHRLVALLTCRFLDS